MSIHLVLVHVLLDLLLAIGDGSRQYAGSNSEGTSRGMSTAQLCLTDIASLLVCHSALALNAAY